MDFQPRILAEELHAQRAGRALLRNHQRAGFFDGHFHIVDCVHSQPRARKHARRCQADDEHHGLIGRHGQRNRTLRQNLAHLWIPPHKIPFSIIMENRARGKARRAQSRAKFGLRRRWRAKDGPYLRPRGSRMAAIF